MNTRTHFYFENSLLSSNKRELGASISEIMHDLSLLSDGQTTCTLRNQAKTSTHQSPPNNNEKKLHSGTVSGILGFATFLCETEYSEGFSPLDRLILKNNPRNSKLRSFLRKKENSSAFPVKQTSQSFTKSPTDSHLERLKHH